MTTATLNPKTTDPAEHDRRLKAEQLRVTGETAEWVRSRREILTTSFLAVDLVRERAEQVANVIWATEGLDYETCERLTELVFGIADPPSRRIVHHVRGTIPADPLCTCDGILGPLRGPGVAPGERGDVATSSESTSTADAAQASTARQGGGYDDDGGRSLTRAG